jgi:hypothetical protein
MESNNAFWMVYVEHGEAPTVRHKTMVEAQKEAMRLTERTKRPTHVLKSVGCYEIPMPRPEWREAHYVV